MSENSLTRPSKINKVFLVWKYSKFGEGGPYFCYYSKIYYLFLCKVHIPKPLLTHLENGEALIIFVISSLLYPKLEESVCNVIINDNQALLSIYFHHNCFRNKVMEQIRKITKIFQNLEKSVRAGTRNTWFFFYLA